MRQSKVSSNQDILQMISNNIFYVLGLPSKANYSQVYSKINELEKKIKLDLEPNYKYEFLVTSQGEINQGKLQNIRRKLNMPKKRVEERLLWFFNPEKSIDDFKEGKMWFQANKLFNNESILDQHDGALIGLIYLSIFDGEISDVEKWQTIINMWKKVLGDENLISKIQSMEASKNKVNLSSCNIQKKNSLLDKIIKLSLLCSANQAIDKKDIITLDNVLYLIDTFKEELKFMEEYKMKLIDKIEDEVSLEAENLKNYREDIKRDDGNVYVNQEYNRELCNNAWNKYLNTIEPFLVVVFSHLNTKSAQLKRIREKAAEVLHYLAIDYTWAMEREQSKKIIEKALKISFDTPVDIKLKSLRDDLGKANNKKKKETFLSPKIDSLIIYNPFRLLDISSSANAQEIDRAIKRLEIKFKYELSLSLSWGIPSLPELNLSQDVINEVKNKINNPRKKYKARLFWFSSREKQLLKESYEDTIEVAFYWYQNTSSLLKKRDALLLALIELFTRDEIFNQIENWAKTLFFWITTIKELEYKQSFSSKDKSLMSLSDKDIYKEYVGLIKRLILDWVNYNLNRYNIGFFEKILRCLGESTEINEDSEDYKQTQNMVFDMLKKQLKSALNDIDTENIIKAYEEVIIPYQERLGKLCEDHNLPKEQINNLISEKLCMMVANRSQLQQKKALEILHNARSLNSNQETIDKIEELIESIEAKEDSTDDEKKDSQNKNEDDSKIEKTSIDNIGWGPIIIFLLISLLFFLSQINSL